MSAQIRKVMQEEGIALTLPSAICPRSRRSAGTRKSKDVSKDPLIYLLVDLTNGKGYVGKALHSHNRMWEHETGKTMRGKKKGKAQLVDQMIQLHGWNNFLVVWLETNVPPEKRLEREGYWMDRCGTMKPSGYNVMPPGVEVISMDDPVIRARWEAANPEGVRKATATKRANREAKLERMDPSVAEALRCRLDKEAARNGKRHRGEEMDPDGRYGRNDKRRATWAAKQEANMAGMTTEERVRYLKKVELGKKYRERNAFSVLAKNQAPGHVEWMKGYRERNKGKRVTLG